MIFLVHTSYVITGIADRMRARGILRWNRREAVLTFGAGFDLSARHVIAADRAVRFIAGRVGLMGTLLVRHRRRLTFLSTPGPHAESDGFKGVAVAYVVECRSSLRCYVVLPLLAWALRRKRAALLTVFWLATESPSRCSCSRMGAVRHLGMCLYAPCFVAGARTYHTVEHVATQASSSWWKCHEWFVLLARSVASHAATSGMDRRVVPRSQSGCSRNSLR
jgi:hypothetical protein